MNYRDFNCISDIIKTLIFNYDRTLKILEIMIALREQTYSRDCNWYQEHSRDHNCTLQTLEIMIRF